MRKGVNERMGWRDGKDCKITSSISLAGQTLASRSHRPYLSHPVSCHKPVAVSHPYQIDQQHFEVVAYPCRVSPDRLSLESR